jgi:hypothetical protein
MERGEWMRGFEAIPSNAKTKARAKGLGSENMTIWHLVHYTIMGTHHGFWSRGILTMRTICSTGLPQYFEFRYSRR